MLFSSKTMLKNCFLLLKWYILAFFGWRGNLSFPDFIQKKFYNINYSVEWWLWLQHLIYVTHLNIFFLSAKQVHIR